MSTVFPIRPRPQHRDLPPFQQPLPLLTFSYTSSRELVFDDSALKDFAFPFRSLSTVFGKTLGCYQLRNCKAGKLSMNWLGRRT